MAELHNLQHQRKERVAQQFNQARMLYEDAERAGEPFDPAEFGFDFSNQEFEAYLADFKKKIAIRTRSYFNQKRAA